MAENPTQYLEQLANRHPEIAEHLNDLASLYDRKLWHQVTTKLEEVLLLDVFQKDHLLIDLYNNFISSFALKLNPLKLAQLAVIVSKQYTNPEEGVKFLTVISEKVSTSALTKTEEPSLFMQTRIAQYKLELGELTECKKLIENGKETLESLSDVDPSVSASVYYVASLYYKQVKDFVQFYKSSLMYLAYVSSESLPEDFKLALAVDISLAALLGDNVYNFGELLLHPIITVLDGTPFQWLHELLQCFHDGDMHRYDEFCVKNASVLNAQPALVQNERKLREKITILSLMVLIFSTPAENRTIPLQTITERTKLNIDGVEFLLMKTLSLHLIEGIMDQVDGHIQVTWVQPRVLTLPQIDALKCRLDGWIQKVNSASLSLESNSMNMIES